MKNKILEMFASHDHVHAEQITHWKENSRHRADACWNTQTHTRIHMQAHAEPNQHASRWWPTCGSGYWFPPSERISLDWQHLPLSPVLGVTDAPGNLLISVPKKQIFRSRYAYRWLYTTTRQNIYIYIIYIYVINNPCTLKTDLVRCLDGEKNKTFD